MSNFLDKTGLSYFWEKVKSWSNNRFYKKTGGDLDGDITFVKKEGQVARSIGFGNTGADGAHLTFSGNAIQFSGPEGSFLAMSGKKIELLGDASMDTDAVTYKQLKERAPSSPGNSQVGWVATVVEDGEGGVKPEWKEPPKELPEGGTDGQILTKTSNGVAWQNAPEGGVTQEQADERYLQLTGGTLNGNLNVGSYNNSKAIYFDGPDGYFITPAPEFSSSRVSLYCDDTAPTAPPGQFSVTGPYFVIDGNRPILIKAKSINMNQKQIINLADPTDDYQAVNKRYVDSKMPKATLVSLDIWYPVETGTGFYCNVSVTGILADESKQMIQPIPKTTSQSAYYAAGIMCTGQATNSLTFTCQTVPTEDLEVYVVIQELAS